jgi:hypothetical protein
MAIYLHGCVEQIAKQKAAGTTPTKGIVTRGSKRGYQQNKGAEAAQMSKIDVMAAICKTGHGAKRKKKESQNYSL